MFLRAFYTGTYLRLVCVLGEGGGLREIVPA